MKNMKHPLLHYFGNIFGRSPSPLEENQRFVLFEGRNTEQMPKLIKNGRVPISFAGLMQRRLEVLNSNASQEVKDSLWNTSFDTGDAPAYDTQGNMKVVLDAQLLRKLTPKSKLLKGALVLPEGTYASLQGEEFTQEQLAQYAGKRLNKRQLVDNPMWVSLARGNKTLLAEYGTAAFARAKEFGYDTAMGIVVDSPFVPSLQEKENMRLWVVGVDDYLFGAGGDVSLDEVYGRLVGIAPEALEGALSLEEDTLEGRLSLTRTPDGNLNLLSKFSK